jgi:anti-sigma factor RsiW
LTDGRIADGDDHVRLDLGLYVLGKLAPTDRQAIRRHLARCEDCLVECKQINAVAEAFGAFSEAQLLSLADDDRSPGVTDSAR